MFTLMFCACSVWLSWMTFPAVISLSRIFCSPVSTETACFKSAPHLSRLISREITCLEELWNQTTCIYVMTVSPQFTQVAKAKKAGSRWCRKSETYTNPMCETFVTSASTTLWDTEFHRFTTLWQKNFFQIFRPHFAVMACLNVLPSLQEVKMQQGPHRAMLQEQLWATRKTWRPQPLSRPPW